MVRFPAKVRKIGNSLGIVIPIEAVEKLGIKPNSIQDFEIHKEEVEEF